MIKFIAKSEQLQKLVTSLQLTKKFYVSSLIVGEDHIGKRTLASYIMPEAPVVNGEDLQSVLDALSRHEEVIICNFTQISNFSLLNFDNKRVIATARYQPKDPVVDELFGYIYHLDPLRMRPEDTKALAQIFLQKACKTLSIDKEIELNAEHFDLSNNSKSLEKSIYKRILFSDIGEEDIEQILYGFFIKSLEGDHDYKKFLPLFERPLLQAGLQKYRSQLKLAGILGINRNTLRKKVNEYGL